MAEVKETIGMDTLDKIDIRVGTIKLVEDVEGSDRLVKFTVHSHDRPLLSLLTSLLVHTCGSPNRNFPASAGSLPETSVPNCEPSSCPLRCAESTHQRC